MSFIKTETRSSESDSEVKDEVVHEAVEILMDLKTNLHEELKYV